jgi:hypothetical protein
MGNCKSTTALSKASRLSGCNNEVKISKKVDKALQKARQRDSERMTLLMFGPEGVSTSAIRKKLVRPTNSSDKNTSQEVTTSSKLVSECFQLDEIKFELCDASRLRCRDLRKWVDYFSDILEVLIFVVPLSWYDEERVLPGGKRVNRMAEALESFRSFCKTFTKTSSVMLLFTEKDVFMEKIRRSNISDQEPFMDFLGSPGQARRGIHYFMLMFKRCLDELASRNSCYMHVTSENDPNVRDFVLDVARSMNLTKRLNKSSFVYVSWKEDTYLYEPEGSTQTAQTWFWNDSPDEQEKSVRSDSTFCLD